MVKYILLAGNKQAGKKIWLPGQAVKTLASHAGIRGSIPLGVIVVICWIPLKRGVQRFFYR